MPHGHSRRIKFPLFARFGILLVLWLMLSWLVADAVLKARIRKVIQSETIMLNQMVANTAEAIDHSLDYLHGIPVLVAKDEKIALALSSFNAPTTSIRSVENRKRVWSQNLVLKRVDTYLEQVGNSLGADVVWITNASGDCIASSNSHTAESFVGTNYADRDYFRKARIGKIGQQYAMGRKTNIPGLYFSAPIMLNGRFAGVAVTKIDLPKLEHWVKQTNAFISDEHGVIILAQESALNMQSIEGADVSHLSEAEREARYKRTDFPPLALTSWDTQNFPTLIHFDHDKQPLLISSKPIADELLEVHAFTSLPEVASFEQERINLFLLLGTTGTLILLVVTGVVLVTGIRKRSEFRAAQSASLLRAAIEATIDGILVVDNERNITAYNQRFIDIWHIPGELVASGRSQDVLNYVRNQPEDPQEFLGRIMELYAHPGMDSFDTLHLKDGTDIERYSVPQRLGDKIVGRVWSFRDVTAAKRAEQALRDSRDGLENKVQERTADLRATNLALLEEKAAQEKLIKQLAEAHSQLLQSDKMASIGQLAAGVAHEINNPVGYVNSNLRTLQGYVDDLLNILSAYELGEAEMSPASKAEVGKLKQTIDITFVRDDIRKLMSESIEGLQRIKRIVLDLKDFSHVGATEKQWANIERGLDSTLNVVWNELKYKADVIKEYGGIPDIECVPSQINQVFLNLLMNAVQAIEVHGTITIRTGQEGENVWVEIADTGTGIAPQNLSRIFDPFFTTKPIGKGTGLGLSLSYNIVQKHGGKIELRSEQGKGTVFKVVLPRQSGSGESGASTGVKPDEQ